MGVEIKELDVVALLIDLPEQGLRCGDVGTVVHAVEANEQHSVFTLSNFTTKKLMIGFWQTFPILPA